MSFDIFLQCYRNGETVTFKRELVEELFGPSSGNFDPHFMRSNFSDLDGGDIYLEGEDNQGLMFNHCGGDRFFQAMWELADRTQSIIFWPDRPPGLAITTPETLKHLPPDLLDGFRPAKIVRSGKELSGYIEADD